MTGWQEYRLDQVVKFQRGHDLTVQNICIGDYPVAGSNGIIGYHSAFTTQAPGITLGRSGNSIGVVHYYKQNFWAHNTTLYSTEFIGSYPKYLYYFLKEIDFTSFNTGSAVPSLNRNHIHSLKVRIPPLPEQKAIAAVLSSLDDKIDLLHRQNATLEAMAEALFSQLFITTESQKKLSAITEWISFNQKRTIAKGDLAPYLEMSNVNTTTFHPSDIAYKDFSSGMKFINGDTLLARITPCLENGKTCYVTFLENEQVGWGSTEYIVMRPGAILHPFFAYCLAKTDDFRGYAENCLTGSSGRQRVDAEHLKQYEIASPTRQSIEEFNGLAASIVPKLHNNFVQSLALEKLRDTLLPKLMSGEVRVQC